MAAAIELTACPRRDGDGRPGDWSISKQETGLAGYVTFVLGVATYHVMQQIVIDVPAGQLSAELKRRGVASDAKVHVVVEFLDDGKLPMTVISEAGRAQDWLANEPDLYDDSDLVERAS